MSSLRGFWRSMGRNDGATVNSAKPSVFVRPKPDRQRQYQVGLDFGTSMTKAAWRAGSDGGVRAINFGAPQRHLPSYVLPSQLVIRHGRLVYGREAAAALAGEPGLPAVRNFKVVLAGKHSRRHADEEAQAAFDAAVARWPECPTNHAPEYVSSLFLAYAIRESRRRLAHALGGGSGDHDAVFNVCLPIDYTDDSELWRVFQRVLACAEMCAGAWDRLEATGFRAADWLELWTGADYGAVGEALYQRSNPAARVFAVSESVAQLADFVLSDRRRPGQYALIDFGAGTTDFGIFRITDDRQVHFLASRNIPAGALRLERQLDHEIFGGRATWSELMDLLEDCIRPRDPKDPKITAAHRTIRRHCRGLRELSKEVWGCATERLRDANAWRKVMILPSGGAAWTPHVAETFAQPVPFGLGARGVRYDVRRMKRPGDYESHDWAPFERMIVAYGLSFPAPKLLKVVPPSRCPDHTPRTDPSSPVGVDDGGHSPVPGPGWSGGGRRRR